MQHEYFMNAALNKVVCWQFLPSTSINESRSRRRDKLNMDRQAQSNSPLGIIRLSVLLSSPSVLLLYCHGTWHKAAAEQVKQKAQNALIARQFPDNVSAQFACLISIRSQSAQRMIPTGLTTPATGYERGIGEGCCLQMLRLIANTFLMTAIIVVLARRGEFGQLTRAVKGREIWRISWAAGCHAKIGTY